MARQEYTSLDQCCFCWQMRPQMDQHYNNVLSDIQLLRDCRTRDSQTYVWYATLGHNSTLPLR